MWRLVSVWLPLALKAPPAGGLSIWVACRLLLRLLPHSLVGPQLSLPAWLLLPAVLQLPLQVPLPVPLPLLLGPLVQPWLVPKQQLA